MADHSVNDMTKDIGKVLAVGAVAAGIYKLGESYKLKKDIEKKFGNDVPLDAEELNRARRAMIQHKIKKINEFGPSAEIKAYGPYDGKVVKDIGIDPNNVNGTISERKKNIIDRVVMDHFLGDDIVPKFSVYRGGEGGLSIVQDYVDSIKAKGNVYEYGKQLDKLKKDIDSKGVHYNDIAVGHNTGIDSKGKLKIFDTGFFRFKDKGPSSKTINKVINHLDILSNANQKTFLNNAKRLGKRLPFVALGLGISDYISGKGGDAIAADTLTGLDPTGLLVTDSNPIPSQNDDIEKFNDYNRGRMIEDPTFIPEATKVPMKAQSLEDLLRESRSYKLNKI